jgi:mannose-6-phosphate isomerase-like protein (cupin superfamily)
MTYIDGSKATGRIDGDLTVRNLLTRPVSENFSIAVARLDGEHPISVSLQSDRAYYITSGQAEVIVGNESHSVRTGDVVYIPKGTRHGLSGNVEYVVVNAPPFDPSKESQG